MRLKRVGAGLHVCAGVVLVALLFYPVRSGLIKLIMVASAATVLIGLCFWIRKPVVRFLALGVLLAAGLAVLFLPGRSVPTSELQRKYVDALRSYEGVSYVWGGEGRLGVDCSGIVRSAWVDSHLRLGMSSASPELIRRAISTWWFDASAKELSAGFSGRTRQLHSAKSIRVNQDQGLQPGDVAVVAQGVHALAYLGDHTWIEADPGAKKVIVIKTSDANPWLDSSAIFVRWRALD
jgi:hypothetical protein